MKNPWLIALAVSGSLILAAVAWPFLGGVDRLLIVAQDPTFTKGPHGSLGVTGHFELTKPSLIGQIFGAAAIPSVGTGGACLVAEMLNSAGEPISCTNDSSCLRSPMEEQILGPHTEYCQPVDKTCWFKVENWCNKSGNYKPVRIWSLGVVNDTNDTPVATTKGRRWRVYACTNGIDEKTGLTNYDCGGSGPNSMHNWGNAVAAN
jgi:hypothetical protein